MVGKTTKEVLKVDNPPRQGKLYLVKGSTHTGWALGRCVEEPGMRVWHVQPFKGKWYTTYYGIYEWKEVI